ncbi:DUF58 domain-containing protein [Denitratisoma oestradiolicum]|uniref:DUF58 domain-containing protein n=1 Tax=Denitratisoma oestradiolicum TaxID=311182 RepID=A0A6S6YQX6_9PROT|nr:DUF58 domain-containing protein [Denitratisoma oestradiolicum]TWO80372.1 hypothetical protein CBW56_09705 [Denitratisoma oestradiolicum]CAB1370172.1 conserved protein of unknown function [Denitratisoma oestradiolicum]
MFGKRAAASASAGTAGVYTSLADLVALEHRSLTSAAGPRQPLASLLAGRHGSRMRGRGLDFLEMRHYLPGDDVRAIDWRVSARTGRPHVRVYAEERDRPVVLVVDQRRNMFFATRRAMKSVVAAEAAALLGWALRRGGDRVGALVFDDRDLAYFPPHRGRAGWLRILGEIVRRNQALSAGPSRQEAPAMLNAALARLLQTLSHDHLIVLLSDFAGVGEESRALVAQLARRHELLALPVWDPGAGQWPERGQYVVSDGALQLALSGDDAAQGQRLADLAAAHRREIQRWREELAVPALPLTTAEDVAAQLRRALAVDPGRQVRER